MGKNKWQIFGTIALVVSALASIVGSKIDRKQTDLKIEEEVQKHLTAAMSNKEG